MTAGLFGALTRPELDELIAVAEKADRIARIALVNAPLSPEGEVHARAGVAADCMALVVDTIAESIGRMTAELALFDPPDYQHPED